MSWRDAPLYVEAHDLAADLLGRLEQQPARGYLETCLATAACDLLTAVSLALSFPAGREAHLRHADEAALRLRVLLRLARDLRLLTPGGARALLERSDAAGRMIGGWKKRQRPRGPPGTAAADTT